ncbi:MAG: hypothetical protein U0667_17235 [Chloroflexota bacterium]
MLDRLRDLLDRQPIVVIGAAVTGVVVAGINLVNAVWPGTVGPDTVDSLTKALAGMWASIAAFWALVTPVRAPKLPEGTDVLLPDGTAGTVVRD